MLWSWIVKIALWALAGYLASRLMKDGKPVGPFGVMGAYMQPQGHVQMVMDMFDFGLDIQETLNVNFIGTFALTKALMPLLTKNEGRIVNVTVPSEISPYWHPLAYVASKAAQNAMVGVMAIEFQQSNTPLEIFTVHPGPTTTDLNGNMALPGFHDIETVGQKMAELINDGQNHQGEFIELYPIVKED